MNHYYAAIFTSDLREAAAGYEEVAEAMLTLARQMPGFLGEESVRDTGGKGITVSYWESMEAIRAWSEHPEHRAAKARGRQEWYRSFRLRIAQVPEPWPGLESSS